MLNGPKWSMGSIALGASSRCLFVGPTHGIGLFRVHTSPIHMNNGRHRNGSFISALLIFDVWDDSKMAIMPDIGDCHFISF